jgi:beta-glucosidase/6-phospho-beta-glucosidase/beta-galactosidase
MDNGSAAKNLSFPADFVWGVATSSHQVEGGNLNNQWTQWEDRDGSNQKIVPALPVTGGAMQKKTLIWPSRWA